MSSVLRLAALLLTAAAAGCASLDPHNVLGRHAEPAASSPSDVPSPPLGEPGRQRALDHVWTVVNERYVDPGFNGVDWAAARARWEPVALAATDDEAFWLALDRMTGELRDAHTRVESPARAARLARAESVGLGIGARWLDGALTVTSVRGDAGAYWAGLRPGMTILAVDGEPAASAYRRWLGEARQSSTPRAQERAALRPLLSGEPGSRVRLTVARADGTDFEARLTREPHRSPPRVSHRLLPSGVGYIRLSNWSSSVHGDMVRAITALRDAPGLVIDLRSNPGGELNMVRSVAAHLVTGTVDAGRTITRTGKPVTLAFDWVELIKVRQEIAGKGTYAGPLVILVNGESASASEFFSGALQATGRATVVGETTCGCLLAYLGYAAIPGGGRLAYSEVDFVLADGRRIEGTGVVPDVAVPTTLADLRASRDRALEVAQERLLRQTGASQAASLGR